MLAQALGLLGVGLFGVALPRLAHAQSDADPLRSSGYAVDMFQGPVVTSTRVTGLGGAYVAIAEGVDGSTQNPAAPAVRTPWSRDHFDYDLGFGFTYPSLLPSTDFWNRGSERDTPRSATQRFYAINLAANLQFGVWGIGISADGQYFGLEEGSDPDGWEPEDDDVLTAEFAQGHAPQVARTFADGQLAIGLGLRTTGLTMSRGRALFGTTGTGWEAGLLWRPNDEPFRFGAAFRSEIRTRSSISDSRTVQSNGQDHWLNYEEQGPDGQVRIERLYLPHEVVVPWDLNVGVAIQIGPRPFNPRWVSAEDVLARTERYLDWRARERERRRERLLARLQRSSPDPDAARAALDAELTTEEALDQLHLARTAARVHTALKRRFEQLPRSYFLISTSMVVTGPVDQGIGIEGFLEQREHRSGDRISWSPRLGVEAEAIPEWVKLRAGSYLEPGRLLGSTTRPHATFGFEAKVLPWTVFGVFEEGTRWRISGVVDAARNYFSWGASFGVWR